MKKFYSVRLKHYTEHIPPAVAQEMLREESNLMKWLHQKGALEFRYIEKRNRLECYANEKHLFIGRIMYPDIFNGRGRMGFMELYISRMIRKRLERERGSG